MNFFGYDPLGMYAHLFGGIGAQPLSAAGRLLASLDKAAARVTDEDDITDELRCALRRADIKASREQRA